MVAKCCKHPSTSFLYIMAIIPKRAYRNRGRKRSNFKKGNSDASLSITRVLPRNDTKCACASDLPNSTDFDSPSSTTQQNIEANEVASGYKSDLFPENEDLANLVLTYVQLLGAEASGSNQDSVSGKSSTKVDKEENDVKTTALENDYVYCTHNRGGQRKLVSLFDTLFPSM